MLTLKFMKKPLQKYSASDYIGTLESMFEIDGLGYG